MSQAETLLNSIAAYPTNDTTVSTSPINDYLIIDAEGRIINVPATETLFGVETDMNAERKHFQCPRIVGDNIDLTRLGLRINYRNAIGEEDGYVVDDVKVNGEFITFSWKLGGKLFKTKGTIYFAICAVDVDDNGTETCVWNTTLATGNVLEGLRVKLTETEEEQARDILQSLIDTLRKQAASYSNRMTDEGMSWIADLESTGEGERELIESKGAETLATIPEDYTTTYNAANEALRKKAKAILLEEEGEVISVSDASDDYVRGLKVFGKTEQVKANGHQLFDLDSVNKTSVMINHIDSGLRISGWAANLKIDCISSLKPTTKYWVKCTMSMNNKFSDVNYTLFSDNISLILYRDKTNELGEVNTLVCSAKLSKTGDKTDVSYSFTTPDNLEGCAILAYTERYTDANGNVAFSTVDFTNIIIAETSTELYEPYTGGKPSPNPEYPQELVSLGDDINVTIYGKNLVNQPNTEFDTYKMFKVNLPAGTYTFSAIVESNDTDSNESLVEIIPADDKNLYCRFERNKRQSFTFTTESTIDRICVYAGVPYDASINDTGTLTDVQLERGSVATNYESYNAQTITIQRSLPGIPVSSGGNYTDSSGQQWICDEVDFERGVYIQRVKREVLNSHRSWRTNSTYDNIYYTSFSDTADGTGVSMCTHFVNISGDSDVFNNSYTGAYFEYEYSQYNKYFNTGYDTVMDFVEWLDEQEANGTPVTLNYVLKTPIETSLTADELNAFRALHTNYPNTTVLNDSGATMRLEYNADTKLFINQPRIPTFDFTEMGLSPVKYNDMTEYTNVDTSEIEEALSKGLVKFKLKVLLDDDGNGVDEYIDVEFIANGTYMSQGEISMFQATSIILISGITFVSIIITEGVMVVMFGGDN